MCAAIHAVTNGLIEYLVYTTLMYTQSFAVYMANTKERIIGCKHQMISVPPHTGLWFCVKCLGWSQSKEEE